METFEARTFIVTAAFLVFFGSSAASAQPIHPECPERPKYDKDAKTLAGNWFKRAQELVDEEKFDEALAAFGCSYKLVPHPATLFNMSQTAKLADENKLALELIRKYLRDDPNGPYAETLEQQVIDLVKKLDEPLEGPESPEDKPPEDEIDTENEVEKEPDAETEELPPPPPPPGEESFDMDDRVIAYGSFGVAGASAAVGVLMTVLSVQAQQDAEDAHGGSYQKAQDYEDKSRNFAIGAAIGYVGAAALTTTGIVLLMTAPEKENDEGTATVQVTPTLGGLVVKGAF